MSQPELEHWSNYWRSGVQTSLPQDFKENYDGEILSFWNHQVEQLEDGAKIVDVCTGNGAIAIIMAKMAIKLNKKIQITAVDISKINTNALSKRYDRKIMSMINFKSHCRIEQLHEQIEHEQDLIVSQYGLEYSDLNLSAQSMAKVMKSGGRLVFLSHSSQSDVFQYMKVEFRIYEWLEDIGIVGIFNKLVAKKISPDYFKKKVFKITSEYQPPVEFQSQPLFGSWLNLIRQFQQMSDSIIYQQTVALADFLKQHRYAKSRANDMLNVAEKVKDDGWLKPLVLNGLTLKQNGHILYKEKHMAGDWFEFQKVN